MLCERLGIDIWEVIDAAATKPFGFMRFEPGPGMGGHCLPVDPFYLAFKAREHDFYTEFIELAGKINQNQPRVVRAADRARAERRRASRCKGSRILLLGVSYKAGVGDIRESPALKIIAPRARAGRRGLLPRPLRRRAGRARTCARSTSTRSSADCDLACIVTAHPEVDYERVVAEAPLVLDFRGVTRGIEAENLRPPLAGQVPASHRD